MRIARQLSALCVLLATTACATASVSYSDAAPGAQPVSARSSKLNFLGFTPTSMERLTALRDSLSEQCGGRGVTGVVARTSTVYVLIGSVEKTEVMGYCVDP